MRLLKKYEKADLERKVSNNIRLQRRGIFFLIIIISILVIPYILNSIRFIAKSTMNSISYYDSKEVNKNIDIGLEMDEKYRPLINNGSLPLIKTDKIDNLEYSIYSSEENNEIVINFKNEFIKEDFILSYKAEDFNNNYIFINQPNKLEIQLIDVFNKKQINIEELPTGNKYELIELNNPVELKRKTYYNKKIRFEAPSNNSNIKIDNEELTEIYNLSNTKYSPYLNREIFKMKEEINFKISSELGNDVKIIIATNGDNLLYNIIINPKYIDRNEDRKTNVYLFGYRIEEEFSSKERLETYLDENTMNLNIEDSISEIRIKINVLNGEIKLEEYKEN